MAFKTIHTLYGLQRMAAAEAAGTPINLVQMAVGDGGGNPTTPTESQDRLVREMFRAAVNRVYQDPKEPRLFTAELVIPASVGGFVIREAAVIDATGLVFAVANIPDAYKPTAAEGAFADTVIRLQFMVSNASIVTLQIDPNVAVATQSWLIANITPAMLIPGGTTNQLLAKRSNANGDFKWTDLDGINVTVDCIEETQTLATSQTTVNLVTTTTRGLALYIEGVRLRADQWTPDPIVKTRLTLAQSWPSGTKLVAAQNDPKGVAPDPLVKGQNLADVPNKELGRSNLGVDSKANTDTHAPVATIRYSARNAVDAGWLKANGAAVSRTAYAALFAAIGTLYGPGDGFNTFNLPDLRGEHLRGWDDGRGVDPGRVFGSFQGHMLGSHGHAGVSNEAGFHGHIAATANAGNHSHTAQTGGAGAHGHTGSTEATGTHDHGAATHIAGFHNHDTQGTPGIGQGATGPANTVQQSAGYGKTSGDGNHVHGINPDGNHIHGLRIDPVGEHGHTVGVNVAGEHIHAISIEGNGQHYHNLQIELAGGSETRGRNVALLAVIKY